jgi:hypothetical protein
MKITFSPCPSDNRSAMGYVRGLRTCIVVFVAGRIPANQYHQLIHGFPTLGKAKSYCAENGLAWFKTAQG